MMGSSHWDLLIKDVQAYVVFLVACIVSIATNLILAQIPWTDCDYA